MDLDDEELEATRRLNGVAKKNNIEEDIKRCEELVKPEHANWIGISNQLAIAHVVDRAKEVENDLTTAYLKGYADAEEKHKKRIKELEEALLKVKDKNTTLFITCRNSIPKQKVKDVLAEIQKEYEKLDKASDEFLSNKEKTVEDYVLEKERLATMQTLAYCRDNLEELLEESK